MHSQPPPHIAVGIDLMSFDAACFQALAAGLPFRRARTLTTRLEPLSRMPSRSTLRLHTRTSTLEMVLGEASGGAFLIRSEFSGDAHVEVAAATAESADALLTELIGDVPTALADSVDVQVWRYGRAGAMSWSRRLTVPSRSEIERNYAPRTATQLTRLTGMNPLPQAGGLILFSGAPGTGKTSAIRALLRSWRERSRAHLVPDPEHFFGDSSYLIDVLGAEHSGRSAAARGAMAKGNECNVVICEDADDFISRDNRRIAGSGVGRLLNLADGLLGQGLKTIILLTSNCAIRELDPALSRPGRCLAQIEFERFDTATARSWLADPRAAIPAGGLTLAELYERSGHVERLHTVDSPHVVGGTYL